jgi:type IV pilus assembly protein PilE
MNGHSMTAHRKSRGFTLIEVMVVMAIIGILAAIAYPSYKEQVARGRRADAKAALMERAQWLERLYSVSGKYNKLADGTTTVTADALPALETRTSDFYTLTLPTANLSASGFTLQLVPKSGSAMANDRCGTFGITNTGSRTPTTPDDCWNR